MEVSWVFLFKDCFSVFIVKERDGMRTMFWIIVCFGIFGVFAQDGVTNHNEHAHKALCDVLRAAVSKWVTVKDSESPLKPALVKTIFGNRGDSKITPIELPIPEDYTKPVENDIQNTRKKLCGLCENKGQKHYPGDSAPHDLVCLCTPGQTAWPIKSGGRQKLCGEPQSAWESVDNVEKGWFTGWSDTDKGKKYINKTWTRIAKKCLENGDGHDLGKALEHFKNELWKNNKYLGKEALDCDGMYGSGVCVKYPSNCETKTWWHELEEAIPKHKEWEARQNLAAEKENQLKAPNGPQTAPQKRTQSRQPTPRSVSMSPQNEESQEQPRAEQVISNMNATIEEDSSTIIYPFWLLLVLLYN
ncbi:Variant surface glycoprotein [Trypanosoma congolense IL3000]|uniref:Variant surface glycoprotein n=1 Tax=Trypanosoma congolense (strain IL3000) TaxID=1068625 RepID=F9WI50_TRYCI|nr:Variant surface glycoprotein [Trypanosoma congolense IL3000]